MAQMKWMQGSKELRAFGRSINCICDVRNEINSRRHPDQIVYSIPDHEPYQPRIFPEGVWDVERPRKSENEAIKPIFIPTNAYRVLPVWELRKGKYFKPTSAKIIDKGYGLHVSTWRTSLGCIVIDNLDDLYWIVDKINEAMDKGEAVQLKVYI